MDDKLPDRVFCTGCGACLPWCPMELDIPLMMLAYDDGAMGGVEALPEDKRPSACLTCWKCTRMCPENIPIPKVMRQLATLLAK